jgi:hypothetical protein
MIAGWKTSSLARQTLAADQTLCLRDPFGVSKQMFVLESQVFLDEAQYLTLIGLGFGTFRLKDRFVHALRTL